MLERFDRIGQPKWGRDQPIEAAVERVVARYRLGVELRKMRISQALLQRFVLCRSSLRACWRSQRFQYW